MNPSLLVVSALAWLLGSEPLALAQGVGGLDFIEMAGLSPYNRYKTFETEHFRFLYTDGLFPFTEKAAAHYERVNEILGPILQWKPRSKVTVLIAENDDSANGFTLPNLGVGMVLIATPPETWFSTSYTEDWIKLLVFHEYTHFLNIDARSGVMDWGAKILFGDLIRPNGTLPPWMLEGLAVYFETRTSKLGRGRSPYYEGILRAMVREERLDQPGPRGVTLDRVTGEYPYFPGGEVPYLFGYHLWQELAKDFAGNDNPESVMGEISMKGSAHIPFLNQFQINGDVEHFMKRDWKSYWDSFVTATFQRMEAQIEAVKKEGETEARILAPTDYQALGGAASRDGRFLAYTESTLDDRTRLIVLDLQTGKKHPFTEKVLGAGLAFTPDSKTLIYSALIRESSYNRHSELFALALDSGRERQLTRGGRAKDPALSPDGSTLAWVSTLHGTNRIETATLDLTDSKAPLKNIRTLVTPTAFSILGNPAFSSNQELAFSSQEIDKPSSEIKRVNLKTGVVKDLVSNGWMNRFPAFHEGALYFVSNQTGIDNIYSLQTGAPTRVTNVITGAAFPFFLSNGTLAGSLLSADGWQIAEFNPGKTKSYGLKKSANPDAPTPLTEALKSPSLGLKEDASLKYSPLSSLAPRAWWPLFQSSSNQGSLLSLNALGFDSTGAHQYALTLGYQFAPHVIDGSIQYRLSIGRPILDLGLDSVTTTSRSLSQYRQNQSAWATLSWPVLWIRSQFRPSIGIFTEWNRAFDLSTHNRIAPRYFDRDANTIGPIQDFQYSLPQVHGFRGSLDYLSARSTPLGFMPELGGEYSLAVQDRLNPDHDSLIQYLASFKQFIGLGNHHVLRTKMQWLGASLSRSELSGKDPNDLFDRGEGLGINKMVFRGYSDFGDYTRSAGLAALDYHFPIAKAFGGISDTTPVFLKQVHGFVFGETLYLTSGNFLPSFGGGVTLDTQMLIQLPISIHLEFQNGTRKDFRGGSLLFLSIGSALL